MHSIGIDMSKDTFHAAFDDEQVVVFDNSVAGIRKFMHTLLEKQCTPRDTLIGTESTGVYHLLFCHELKEHGWKVHVINPLVTHRMVDSSIRHVKTDKHDALSIRKAMVLGLGYEYTDTPEILALKTLVQERESLCRVRASMKQRIHAHKIRERASGITLYDSFKRIIDACTHEIKTIEKETRLYAADIQTLLQSIPGIGKTSSAALVATIGDIHRFSTAEKLVAYVGLDPRVHQSGTSIHGKGYISKRGNRYLRTLLFNAAFIARQRNPELRAYYEKKLSEGKHYTQVLVAVERKLLHIVHAVWTRGTPFEKR